MSPAATSEADEVASLISQWKQLEWQINDIRMKLGTLLLPPQVPAPAQAPATSVVAVLGQGLAQCTLSQRQELVLLAAARVRTEDGVFARGSVAKELAATSRGIAWRTVSSHMLTQYLRVLKSKGLIYTVGIRGPWKLTSLGESMVSKLTAGDTKTNTEAGTQQRLFPRRPGDVSVMPDAPVLKPVTPIPNASVPVPKLLTQQKDILTLALKVKKFTLSSLVKRVGGKERYWKGQLQILRKAKLIEAYHGSWRLTARGVEVVTFFKQQDADLLALVSQPSLPIKEVSIKETSLATALAAVFEDIGTE